MIRPSLRLLSAVALVSFVFPISQAAAQTQVPPAPANTPATPTAPTAEPSAPAPKAAPTFPKPDPADFTAASPSKETVNSFLQANWGYDDNRIWQVQAILKTPVDGVTKVIIFVADKTGKEKPGAFAFFVLPGDKYMISGDDVIPFGANPFAENRTVLEQRADGPYRGSADKKLELVEFADFQCPHCKEAQANMDKLATDFPNARIVYQNYPLPQHPEAANAAAYGVCVAKLGGSNAFYSFAAAVFDGQDGLATPDGATLTLNSAVTKAGLDPAKIEACVKDPETAKNVDASVELAKDLHINQTPTLDVNGRPIPANAPYDVLKKIIVYQEKLDGVSQ
ncbi:MAG: thioredoxin domain-containing protein [Terracidiphilus sp.]